MIQQLPPSVRPALVVASLDEMASRIGEAWGDPASAALPQAGAAD
jgi:hypothetical protein